jgi:hypothetical protein
VKLSLIPVSKCMLALALLLGSLLGPGALTPAIHAATWQISLTWADPANDFSGFIVQRRAGTTGSYSQLASIQGSTFSYVDSGLALGSTYCYQVLAYNSAGNSLPSNETCSTVPSSYALTATLAGSGSGTVASSPAGLSCPGTCTASFAPGTSVSLVPTPAAGSTFAGWNGACAGTGGCTIGMTQAASTTTATFTAQSPTSYSLTVTETGSGSITSSPAGISCPGTCTASFASGTSVTLTAAPVSGSTFSGWSGACSGTGSCVVAMTQSRSAAAAFTTQAPITYALTVTESGSGTVTSSPAGITCPGTCTATFATGTAVTLTAAPTAGSTFSGWTGACAGTGSCAAAMTQARAVGAAFATAGGPISFVQVASATPQSPTRIVNLPYPLAQTAGDLNVVVVGWNDTLATVSAVTDTAGNAYRLAVDLTSGNALRQAIYYAPAIRGGATTVTVQFSQPAVYADVRILEYRGVSTLDKVAASHGNSATASTPAVTPSAARELLVAANTVASSTAAAGNGFTQRTITYPDGDLVEDRIVSSVASYRPTAPLTRSAPWVMQMVTFK